MLVIGLILLVLGWVFAIQVLWLIGLLLAVVGAVLLLASFAGHGRRFY